jgi:hypothetical protein
MQIAAPATTVFDVIAAPYLGRIPRAMSGKLQVLQRGTDMVLAEHYTLVHRGRLTAATLETVTFDRPHRIAFRLVRGPVPHITEEFALTEQDGMTRLDYSGELGTDFAAAGQWWAGSRPYGRRRSAPLSPVSGPKQNVAPDPIPPIPDARF